MLSCCLNSFRQCKRNIRVSTSPKISKNNAQRMPSEMFLRLNDDRVQHVIHRSLALSRLVKKDCPFHQSGMEEGVKIVQTLK